MAADTHITGDIYLQAGRSITQTRDIAVLDSEVADNAAGSEPYYLVPAGAERMVPMPRNDGQPLGIAAGPHVLPGELLVIGIKHNGSLADVDTTGATSDVLKFEYYAMDLATKRIEKRLISDETSRNTVTGVAPATDPKLINGQVVKVYAFGPCPPGECWTLAGRVQIDLRTAA
jgi:hypothetical protein